MVLDETQCVVLDGTQCVVLDGTQCVVLDGTQCVWLDGTQCVVLDGTQRVVLDRTQRFCVVRDITFLCCTYMYNITYYVIWDTTSCAICSDQRSIDLMECYCPHNSVNGG